MSPDGPLRWPCRLARAFAHPLALAVTLTLAFAPAGFAAPAPGAGAPAAADSAAIAPGGSSPAAADSAALAAADSSAPAAPAPPVDHLAEIRANFTRESRAYSQKRGALALLDPFYSIAVALLVLATGLSARMRDIAHALGSSRYVRVLVYLTLYSLVGAALGFPFAWYQGFALEHQYALSNQSFGAWLREEGIGLAVSLCFLGVVPLVALAYGALEKQPRRWWLWLALGTLPVILAGSLISPYVDGLTNKFTPLRDQALKREIVALAEKAGIPGRNVYEVDKSRQTRKYNAYVSGFGVSQRIVLWDTTLKGMRKDEILCVMGHEMGHYVLHHIWKGILLTSLLSFLLFFLAARLLDPLVARFGPRWGFTALHDLAAMPLLVAVLTLLSFAAQPVVNGYSRGVEHESDIFGLEITHDNDAAARAFIKLGSQNRSDPEPPAWRVWLQYSHPPLAERVRFAMEYRPWERGEPNRLFRERAAAAPSTAR